MPEPLSKPTLPTFSWIGQLKDDDRELLSSYGEFFPGHPGQIIIEQGVTQTSVFVVISGELEVHATRPDGTRVLRARVGPGETLGEISLFDPGPATATVTASEFSQLWRIEDKDLIEFMEDNPGAGLVLLRTLAAILAQRLRRVDPEAFGLSAYAVIDSPELEITPELDADVPGAQEVAEAGDVAEIGDVAEATPAAEPPPVSSLKPVKPAAGAKPPRNVRPGGPPESTVDLKKKTLPIADPDELEPL